MHKVAVINRIEQVERHKLSKPKQNQPFTVPISTIDHYDDVI